MEIDGNAPAVGRAELEIQAPHELVWEVLTDVEGWPEWNPDVRSASLEGPLSPGTRFRWKAGPGTIVSTLEAVEPPGLIGWTGTTLGIHAIHVHRLEARGNVTVVTSEESWDGVLVRLLRRPLGRSLRSAVEGGLRHLKTEAERRAQAGLPAGPGGYD
ncbi:MAG TPA: SRPBCC family protein [Gaiellaceae bacterium]|nr:SRPBCC family protein [Gaiellaceae bacterium]